MSAIDNLTPEQLEILRAKAKKKLQKRANREQPQVQQQESVSTILTKAQIREKVKKDVAKLKKDSKFAIYRAGKFKKTQKTKIIESTREQLATKYNELVAERDGYKESIKQMDKYANKLLKLEEEVSEYKTRLETPLEDYIIIKRQKEIEKQEIKDKIGFAVKTICTLGFYAYIQGKKERYLRTGGLGKGV